MTIISRSERQLSEISGAVDEGTVRITLSDAGTTLGAVADNTMPSTSGDVALISLGFAYGPADLLFRAYEHHLKSRNDYTRVFGLPSGVVPEIFKPPILIKLSRLQIPGLPTAPGAAADMILRVVAQSSAQPPFRMHAKPFDAGGSYSAVPQDLPEEVSIGSAQDMDVARRVQSSRRGDRDLLGDLRLWREASIQTRLEARTRVFRLAARSASNRPRTPRRILFVSTPSAFSGPEQNLVQLVSRLDRERFHPMVVVGTESLLSARLRETGAEVIIPDVGVNAYAEFPLFLAGLMRNFKPHVIHLNAPSGVVPSLAPLICRASVVSHVRTAETGNIAAQLKTSDEIIAVSEFVKREILKLEIPERSVHVVHNGLDTVKFRFNTVNRTLFRRKFAIPETAKVILTIARFSPEKRHDLLLQAALLAKHMIRDLFLVLSGEVFGESRTYDMVRETIRKYDMSRWIRIIPFAEDLREVYSIADVFVLCSEREGFGQCVIEAMAMGIPTIVTRSGGPQEIVCHGESGFIVPQATLKLWQSRS